MTAWTSAELTKIGVEEELDLISMRKDGTLRKPVTMWVVRIGDGVYVRAYKGRTGPWFLGVLDRHQGHITSAGLKKEVVFEEVTDPSMIEQVDKEYLRKYGHYAAEYVDPMVTPQARAATIRLIPKDS